MFSWRPLVGMFSLLISTFLFVLPVDVVGDTNSLKDHHSQDLAKKIVPLDVMDCDTDTEKVVRKAFEDNSWLALSTEKEMRRYCESIYCPGKVNEMAEKLLEFTEGNSDWHTGAKVRSIEEVGCNGDELLVKVLIDYLELDFSETSKLSFVNSGEDCFMVSLEATENGYKIRGISRMVEKKN